MSQDLSIPFATQDDFLNVALALLPPGDAWPREQDALFTQMVNAAIATQARLHARAADLTEREVIPWTSEDLLPAWEAVYGLPDPCAPLNPTIPQRQAALKARFAASGNLTIDYYQQVAQSLGYTCTFETFRPAACGVFTCGSPLYGETWRFVLQVNVSGIAAFPFSCGVSVCGDPLVSYSDTQLSCVMNRIKPGYADLIMNYEE